MSQKTWSGTLNCYGLTYTNGIGYFCLLPSLAAPVTLNGCFWQLVNTFEWCRVEVSSSLRTAWNSQAKFENWGNCLQWQEGRNMFHCCRQLTIYISFRVTLHVIIRGSSLQFGMGEFQMCVGERESTWIKNFEKHTEKCCAFGEICQCCWKSNCSIQNESTSIAVEAQGYTCTTESNWTCRHSLSPGKNGNSCFMREEFLT